MKKKGMNYIFPVLAAFVLAACGKEMSSSRHTESVIISQTPETLATPESVATPEPTLESTLTPEPTLTPGSTMTPEPTTPSDPTLAPTLTPEPTATPEPTLAPTVTPEPTLTPLPGQKTIYLTFDDGPGIYTEPLLELLDKYNVKATFFVCATGYSYLIEDIYQAGHTIGMHCQYHSYDKVYASEEAYWKDLYAIQDVIYKYTGTRPTILRFPGGSSNTVSSFNPGIMTRLTKSVEEKGFSYFDWNVSSGDTSTKDSEVITQNLIKGTTGMRSAITLQHSEIKEYSLNALEDYLIWALENGYTFSTLSPDSPKAHHRVSN